MAELGSPIGAFVRERCVIAPGRKIRIDHLYADWRTWCTEKGREHPGDEPAFGRNLRSVMPDLKTTNNHIWPGGPKKRHYEGISLRIHGVDPEPDSADDE
jgi:putative DNA primase/helicase